MPDTKTARTWIAPTYGGPGVLELVDADVPSPGPGQVTIDVRAVGMNPADYKGFAAGDDPSKLPLSIGYEVAGVLSAVGPDTEIASGGGAVGDEVLAFRISGGYTTALTVSADDVFAKPASLGFPEAANLLLAGATAAEMLDVVGVQKGDTIVVHGASGAVGVSVLQQARLFGVRVIGTASQDRFDVVRRFGGDPVLYGDGLEQRIRDEAPEGIAAALDTVGTDEAVDVSLALIDDRRRLVSIAAFGRAADDGFRVIGGAMPASAAFRDHARAHLIHLAASGDLVVPMARTFSFTSAVDALELLRTGHPGGKLALVP
ncbi:NADP-dependent oxidoreductase [Frondihabitans cladoniiphilus]